MPKAAPELGPLGVKRLFHPGDPSNVMSPVRRPPNRRLNLPVPTSTKAGAKAFGHYIRFWAHMERDALDSTGASAVTAQIGQRWRGLLRDIWAGGRLSEVQVVSGEMGEAATQE